MPNAGTSKYLARADHNHGPLPIPEKKSTRRLMNLSGVNIDWGDVVVLGQASNSTFITNATLNFSSGWMGVAQQPIASNTRGSVLLAGYTPVVNVGSNSTARGNFLYGSNMARRAYGSNVRTTGAFGQVLSTGVAPDAIIWSTTDPTPDFTQLLGTLVFSFGDGSAVISTGQKGHIRWPFAGTLVRNTVMADQSGSIVIDIWRDSYANFPPTGADSITASAKPTLSAAQKSVDTTLSGWNKTFSEGDIYAFNVDSAATVTRVALELKYQRT